MDDGPEVVNARCGPLVSIPVLSRHRVLSVALGGLLLFRGAIGCSSSHESAPGTDASTRDAAATLDALVPDGSTSPDALDAWALGDAGVHDPAQGPTACGAPAAVAYHIDPAHRGFQPDDQLRLPLAERWRVPFDGRVSYPLVACGRVYVTVSSTMPGAPVQSSVVVALEPETGATIWGPTTLDASPDEGAQAAYDDGHLFVITSAGALYSIDAATGIQQWRVQLTGESSFTVPPLATTGLVVVEGSGVNAQLYAVEQTTGVVRWTQGLLALSGTATDGRTLFAASCGATAFDLASGTMLWDDRRCPGGVATEPSLHAGRVYVRSPMMNLMYDAETGAQLTSFRAALPPAFSQDTGYFVERSRVRAIPDGTDLAAWMYAPVVVFRWAPIVVGDWVLVGNGSYLSVLSRADGSSDIHSFSTGGAAATTEGTTLLPWQDMAEAGGRVFIPIDGGLVAF